MQLTDDIKPIYLGYCKSQKKYYFYFIKESVPRFLSYVTYFYWDRGPQEALVLVPVPEEVEKELRDFLIGGLHYEFKKIRKNSRFETVTKIYRTPQEVGKPMELPSTRSLSGNSAGTLLGHTGVTGNARGVAVVPTPPIRKRRTKKEMEDLKKLLETSGADVVAVSSEVANVKRSRSIKQHISA